MHAPLRVLIVEESDEDTLMLVRELRRSGYEVTFERVSSRQAMIAALERQEWDAVIAEHRLRRFRGSDALAVLRERELDLPFIIVSATVDEDVAVEVLKAGAHDFVSKENPGRLAPAIVRALREVEERRVRREAEEALRASEERYRELVENANDVVLSIDLQGNFTALNRAGEQISGYTREELRRMNLAQVLPPDSLEKAFQMIRQKLADNRPTTYELEMIARDGHRVPLEVSSRLINHGGVPVGVQAIARDITARRQAQEELRTRERKQAGVADLGQDAITMSDLPALFDDAVSCVTRTLDVEFSMVTELIPERNALLARAGVGWRPGLVGAATVPAGPESQAGYTLLSSEPVIVDDLDVETRFSIPPVLFEHGITSGITVIIPGQARPFGVLSAFSANRRRFAPDDAHFLQAVANVLAAAIERKRLEEERTRHSKELASSIIQAQEEERKRIARELHDETAQSLSMLLTNLDLLAPHIPAEGPLREGFERVEALAKRTLDEARALSHDLRPTILDDAGLVAALQWVAAEYERTFGGTAEVDAEPQPKSALSPEVEVALFRIAQEAVSNSGKHAEATELHITLRFENGTACMGVEDNGKGFDLSDVPRPTRQGRLGLFGMRERAALLGGGLTVETAPGKGTRILVEMPMAVSESPDGVLEPEPRPVESHPR